MAVFTPNPFDATYFLPTAAKSKHKFFWNKFEQPQDGLQLEKQDKEAIK
ncbi:MAG: hypothetical protein ABJK37_03240 [Paraglaciecola sp.]